MTKTEEALDVDKLIDRLVAEHAANECDKHSLLSLLIVSDELLSGVHRGKLVGHALVHVLEHMARKALVALNRVDYSAGNFRR